MVSGPAASLAQSLAPGAVADGVAGVVGGVGEVAVDQEEGDDAPVLGGALVAPLEVVSELGPGAVAGGEAGVVGGVGEVAAD